MKRLRRGLGLLLGELATVLGICLVVLPIGLVGSCCVVGVPIVMFGLGFLIRALVHAARGADDEPPPLGWRSGVTAWLGGAVTSLVVVFAVTVVASMFTDGAGQPSVLVLCASAVASAMAVGVALAPLVFTPFVAADGLGMYAASTRSFELAAQLGPLGMARLGAGVGALFALPIVLFLASRYEPVAADLTGPLLLAIPLAVVVSTPVIVALLADEYVRLLEEHAPPESTLTMAPTQAPRVRAMLSLMGPVLLALMAVTSVAALSPLPLRRLPSAQVPPGARAQCAPSGIPTRGPVRRGQVTVAPWDAGGPWSLERREPGEIVIATDDGGGAGRVKTRRLKSRFGSQVLGLRLCDGEVFGGPPGSTAVLVYQDVQHPRGVDFTLIDGDGVRLDDSIRDRVGGRLGAFGVGAVIVGLVFLFAFVFVLGAALGEARSLSVPALGAPAGGQKGLRAVEGRLRLGDGAYVRYVPAGLLRRAFGAAYGELLAHGEAWVEAHDGALRFRFPEGAVRVLGRGTTDGWDGSKVVVVSPFRTVASVGLREASTPWPEGACLVLGHPADASRELTLRASRIAARFAVPSLVALSTAIGKLLLALF